MTSSKMFEVQCTSSRYTPFIGENRQIVFHGVNKSGSLVLSNVLRESYEYAGRKEEFHSHYHKDVASVDDLIARADIDRLNGFYVAHYLWGALKAHPERLFITQFRHPLPRVVSCFQWLKNKHDRRIKKGETKEEFPEFRDFVKATKGKAHSQVMQFSSGFGAQAPLIKKGINSMQMLAISKDAIYKGVHVIGLAERSEESIFMFAHICGLTHVPAWKKDERNKGRSLVSELEKEDLELIKEVYEADILLYEWVSDRFKEQMSFFDFGDSLNEYKEECRKEYKDRILI